MRKLFALIAFSFISLYSSAQGYTITLNTPNHTIGLAYLTYYYGSNMNIADSALVNSKGVAVFKNSKKLPPGIYAIVFPGKYKLVDFLIDSSQVITIDADTADLVNRTK